MKRILLALLLLAPAAFADTTFPGLQAIMTRDEFSAAGLDRLTPAQLGAVNAAIERHLNGVVHAEAQQQAEQIVQKKIEQHDKKGLLQRFGLPEVSLTEAWKDEPSLKAKCVGWVGGNSFKLDNGQVWEGVEPITVELANRDIEIAPRPMNAFCLYVDGKNTTIRVTRLK
ncbi:MAG: hypothetical protein ACHQ4G_01420, partial [Opitutales bacterium]